MTEIFNSPLPSEQPEPAVRISLYHQKGMKIYENNPVELAIADIIDHAQLIQEYGTDRSKSVIGLHRAAQQLTREIEQFLIG
jgi:hypothetical protein